MRTHSLFPRHPLACGTCPALALFIGLALQLGGPAPALATGPITEDRGLQRPASSPAQASAPVIDPGQMQPTAPGLGTSVARASPHPALQQLRAQADGSAPAGKSTPAARRQAQRDAAWQLALVSLHGAGAPQDPAAARRWFERAQELGHPLASAGLAWCAIDGCGEAPQPIAAAPWIVQLRRADPARALYLEWLRARQLAPLSGSRPTAADGLLARAAAGGNPAAQVEYGLALLEGDQRPAALRQFRQAAARSPAAAANAQWLEGSAALGQPHQDADAGARWLAEARRYHRGEGVPANYTEALRLYQRAANAGSAPARRMLQTLYSRPGPGGVINIPWMQQLARLDLDALGQATPAALAAGHAFARDPTPLYDLVPAQWR